MYRIVESDPFHSFNQDRIKGRYRIEKLRFFLYWSCVNGNGKPFHFEHFSHGNDYVFYDTVAEAEKAIKSWKAIKKKPKKDHIKIIKML